MGNVQDNAPEDDTSFQDFLDALERRCYSDATPRPNLVEGDIYCSRIFDGWSCWNDTPAGHTAYSPCPNFIYGFDPKFIAHKECLPDGTWFRHPDSPNNRTWSNYTSCVDSEDFAMRTRVNNIYIIGYSISLVALLLSMIIFFSFRALRCTRITIHKNLFLSFIINNCVWIVWYTTIINKEEVLSANTVGCQVLHVFTQYFLVCNYFWMVCEGLYLHTLLVVAFVNEQAIMKWFYIIGWVIPAVPTGIYAGIRSYHPKQTEHCWTEYSSPYTYILAGTVCLSMLANLIFLINIVRVLVTKLKAVNSPDVNQTRKAARATLILIPLLGLQFLVTPFRPPPGTPAERVYEMVAAVVTSFQGLCVACLFCFFNGEVLAQLMKRWNQSHSSNNRTFSIGATTVSKADMTLMIGKVQGSIV